MSTYIYVVWSLKTLILSLSPPSRHRNRPCLLLVVSRLETPFSLLSVCPPLCYLVHHLISAFVLHILDLLYGFSRSDKASCFIYISRFSALPLVNLSRFVILTVSFVEYIPCRAVQFLARGVCFGQERNRHFGMGFVETWWFYSWCYLSGDSIAQI